MRLVKLASGNYVEVLQEFPEEYQVRVWDFDEKWDAFPTQKVYNIPKREVDGLNNQKPDERFTQFQEVVPFVYHRSFRKYHKWCEDLLQEGYAALWRACCTFKDEGKVAFSTYAINAVNYRMLNYCHRFILKHEHLMSLDSYVVSQTPEGDNLFLIDMVSDTEYPEAKYLLEDCLSQLCSEDKAMIIDILQGYTQNDVAQKYHISQATVHRKLERFKRIIHKEKNKV